MAPYNIIILLGKEEDPKVLIVAVRDHVLCVRGDMTPAVPCLEGEGDRRGRPPGVDFGFTKVEFEAVGLPFFGHETKNTGEGLGTDAMDGDVVGESMHGSVGCVGKDAIQVVEEGVDI